MKFGYMMIKEIKLLKQPKNYTRYLPNKNAI